METETNSTQTSTLPRKQTALAFALGAAPSLLVLGLFSFLEIVEPTAPLLGALCVISFACCLGSSFLFFKRKTGLAIVAGILLFLINSAVSFFFGCATLFTGF